MTHKTRLFRRLKYATAAVGIAVTSMMSLLSLTSQTAFAGAQVLTRSIKMSSSANTAATTSSYTITFNIGSAYAAGGLKGIVVDFCGNDPIIAETACTAPNTSGFSTASVALTSTAGTMDASGWAAAAIDGNQAISFSKAAGNTGAITAGDTQTIIVSGIQNPTGAVGTFYARLYTFSTTAGATGFTAATNGAGYIDYGGFALSTATQITVTAKVQETLTFCVYTGANCGAGGAAISIGDANGVLSSATTAYISSTSTPALTAKLDVASNATNGVKVNAKTAATLTSGVNTIPSIGNACTADSSVATVEQFGFRVIPSAMTSTNYGCAAGNHAFNTANLTSAYGDEIVKTTVPTVSDTASVDFEAKAANTTKSGIYTAVFTFIATGYY